ncbi:hypothetical protein C8R43DRAFT_1126339 [Mycena crocata]|nr:hypothetical protein C8R43DRAFT_1126339 [Mycena crocata]
MYEDDYNPLDDWHPIFERRGRSAAGYTFSTESAAAAIRSEHPYAFVDTLVHQNKIVMNREDHDLVYRGEVVQLHESCTPDFQVHLDVAPADVDDAKSELSSALTDLDTEPATDTDSLTDTSPASPSGETPTEQLGSPFTPAPRRLTTYSKVDKQRVQTQRAAEEQRQAVTRAAEAKAAAKRALRLAQLVREPPRCSHRLLQERMAQRVDDGVYRAENLLCWGHNVVSWEPRDEIFWGDVNQSAVQDFGRLYRRMDFDQLGQTPATCQYGVGYGGVYASPHNLGGFNGTTHREMQKIVRTPALRAIAAYQNHLYQQFAPRVHADTALQITELVDRRVIWLPFNNPVFTTVEVNFGDAPPISTKTRDSAFGTFEAIMSVGSYDHEGGGHVEFWDDQTSFELAPGATIVFPAGASVSLLRWLAKGGRNDKEFDNSAPAEQQEAWERKRAGRGERYVKLYSTLDEIFVV